MIEAVCLVAADDPSITFDIFGEWQGELIASLMEKVPAAMRHRIVFRGAARDITTCLAGRSLYLHCARGESFGVAVIEAMMAGVVPLVSEWTGAREVVSEVSPDLIAPLDARAIGDRIAWYFGLSSEERRRLSRLGRRAAAAYNESDAVARYRAVFVRMCEDLGVLASEGSQPS
jgi:glycosyltransferase involved in cell wall biosynthesis